MTYWVIDRRQAPKGRNLPNRLRYLERARRAVKRAVRRQARNLAIRDVDKDEQRITIQSDGLAEIVPEWDYGQCVNDVVVFGNFMFDRGDRIPKPSAGGSGGGAGGRASDSGEGEDEFTFSLGKDEFLGYLFEGLELPDLKPRDDEAVEEHTRKYAGIVDTGPPPMMDLRRTWFRSSGRRVALRIALEAELEEVRAALEKARDAGDEEEAGRLAKREKEILKALGRIPMFDDVDVRYRFYTKVPQPTTRAVMFCLMDVSGSMGEKEKDIAKRFFMLLYLFLTTRYARVDIVFIRHHHTAEEVDEEKFFYSRESGGTVVSTCLEKMLDIQKERYPEESWNIYAAQASDGDNFEYDANRLAKYAEMCLEIVQYFAYIEIESMRRGSTSVWRIYESLAAKHPHLAMRRVAEASEVYPVFRELFSPKGGAGKEAV